MKLLRFLLCVLIGACLVVPVFGYSMAQAKSETISAGTHKNISAYRKQSDPTARKMIKASDIYRIQQEGTGEKTDPASAANPADGFAQASWDRKEETETAGSSDPAGGSGTQSQDVSAGEKGSAGGGTADAEPSSEDENASSGEKQQDDANASDDENDPANGSGTPGGSGHRPDEGNEGENNTDSPDKGEADIEDGAAGENGSAEPEKDRSDTDMEKNTDLSKNQQEGFCFPEEDISLLSDLNFTSLRLLTAGEIKDPEHILSEHEGVFLLKYEDEKTCKQAYLYYLKHADFVEVDSVIYAAGERSLSPARPHTDIDDQSHEEHTGGLSDTDYEEPEKAGSDRTEKKEGEDNSKNQTQNTNTSDVTYYDDPLQEALPSKMDETDNPLSRLEEAIESAETYNKGEEPDYSDAIALIDTGVSAETEVYASVSMLGDDGTDKNGHGTAMAEVIYAENPDAKILSVKALGDDGVGDVSAVYAGIAYAIEKNVSIINLSMSAVKSADHAALSAVIKEAIQKGITVVASAGNNAKNANYYVPASVEGVITIGACDETGRRLAGSNYGSCVDYYVTGPATSVCAARFTGILSLEKRALADGRVIFSAKEDQGADEGAQEGDGRFNPDAEVKLTIRLTEGVRRASAWVNNQTSEGYLSLIRTADSGTNAVYRIDSTRNYYLYNLPHTAQDLNNMVLAGNTAVASAEKILMPFLFREGYVPRVFTTDPSYVNAANQKPSPAYLNYHGGKSRQFDADTILYMTWRKAQGITEETSAAGVTVKPDGIVGNNLRGINVVVPSTDTDQVQKGIITHVEDSRYVWFVNSSGGCCLRLKESVANGFADWTTLTGQSPGSVLLKNRAYDSIGNRYDVLVKVTNATLEAKQSGSASSDTDYYGMLKVSGETGKVQCTSETVNLRVLSMPVEISLFDSDPSSEHAFHTDTWSGNPVSQVEEYNENGVIVKKNAKLEVYFSDVDIPARSSEGAVPAFACAEDAAMRYDTANGETNSLNERIWNTTEAVTVQSAFVAQENGERIIHLDQNNRVHVYLKSDSELQITGTEYSGDSSTNHGQISTPYEDPVDHTVSYGYTRPWQAGLKYASELSEDRRYTGFTWQGNGATTSLFSLSSYYSIQSAVVNSSNTAPGTGGSITLSDTTANVPGGNNMYYTASPDQGYGIENMWLSDDGGTSWTQILSNGEPAESAFRDNLIQTPRTDGRSDYTYRFLDIDRDWQIHVSFMQIDGTLNVEKRVEDPQNIVNAFTLRIGFTLSDNGTQNDARTILSQRISVRAEEGTSVSWENIPNGRAAVVILNAGPGAPGNIVFEGVPYGTAYEVSEPESAILPGFLSPVYTNCTGVINSRNMDASALVVNKRARGSTGLSVQKVDENGQDVPQEYRSNLAGARFSIQFYEGIHTQLSEIAGQTAKRTWIYCTDETGGLQFANTAHFVSGSELFYNENGTPEIPYGTVLIREVEAPSGFVKDPAVYLMTVVTDPQNHVTETFYDSAGQPLASDRIGQKAGQKILRIPEKPADALLTIIKQLHASDLHEEHGAPNFAYEITGTTLTGENRTFHTLIDFAVSDSVTQSKTVMIPAGTYTVRELESDRYVLTDITGGSSAWTINLTDAGNAVHGIRPKTGSASARIMTEETIAFTNRKIDWSEYSDTSAVINEI